MGEVAIGVSRVESSPSHSWRQLARRVLGSWAQPMTCLLVWLVVFLNWSKEYGATAPHVPWEECESWGTR